MKKFFILVLSLLLAISLAACGGSKNAAESTSTPAPSASDSPTPTPQEPVEITYLAHVTPNYTVEFYQGLIDKFAQQNPNIKVNLIHAPDTDTNGYAKTLLASGSFPDVMNNVDGEAMIKAEAIAEIPIDDNIKKIKNYEQDLYWKDQKLYAINAFMQPALLIYYNKKLFQDAGITELPKTWDDFNAVCKQLKDKGITPIELGGEWTTGFVYGEMISPSVFGERQNWYADRFEGKVHFADDYFQKATDRFMTLVKDGYINKGALSLPYNSMDAEFAKGKIAMYPMGSWASASEVFKNANMDLGVFLPPTEDGKRYAAGDHAGGFIISKTSKHQDAALKLAEFISFDPDVHKAFAEKDSLISNLVDPIAYDMNPLQKEVFDAVTSADAVIGHFNGKLGGRGAVGGMWDAYAKVAQDILLGKAKIAEEMKYMDESWDTNQKKEEAGN